jgi:hypothetical protein
MSDNRDAHLETRVIVPEVFNARHVKMKVNER